MNIHAELLYHGMTVWCTLQGFAPNGPKQTSLLLQMPGMHDDWVFDITTTSRGAMHRNDQQQQAAPEDSHAAGRHHPAASQKLQALTQAPAMSEVPASVKEAVDRFESWSAAQHSLLLPIAEGPAAAVQPDEHSAPEAHSQQQRGNDVKQFQQQQPGLFEKQALPGEQHGAQQRQQALVQQDLPELCPSQCLSQSQQHRQQLTVHQHASQQQPFLSQLASQERLQAQAPGLPQQQHNVRHQKQQYKAPVFEYPDAASSLQESLPMSQDEPPGYRGSSHALGMIDATLAAINDTQTGPAAAAPPSQIQSPAAASAGASHVSEQGTKPAASVSSQRPPLYAHTSALTLSTRPGFADAFANPSLYQQPWLCPATTPDAANAPLSGFGWDHHHFESPPQKQNHSTAAVGPFTAEAADRLGRTHARNSSTARAGDVHHASEELGHSSTAQKGDQQATSAPVATSSTSGRETTLRVPEGIGLRAAQAAYQEAKAASGDRKGAYLSASRSGGAGDEWCMGPSQWSAVNAYRQAREAAERAAEGAAPLSEEDLLIMASACAQEDVGKQFTSVTMMLTHGCTAGDSSGSGMLAQPLRLGSSSHLWTADASRSAATHSAASNARACAAAAECFSCLQLHARHASQHTSCSSHSDCGTKESVEYYETSCHLCSSNQHQPLNMHTAQTTGPPCVTYMHITSERAASGLQGCQTGWHTAMMCKVRACHHKAGPLRPGIGIRTGEHGCCQMPHSLTSARLHQPAQICTIMLTTHSLNAPDTLVNRQMLQQAALLVVDICKKQQRQNLHSTLLMQHCFRGPCTARRAIQRLIALHASCQLEIRGKCVIQLGRMTAPALLSLSLFCKTDQTCVVDALCHEQCCKLVTRLALLHCWRGINNSKCAPPTQTCNMSFHDQLS